MKIPYKLTVSFALGLLIGALALAGYSRWEQHHTSEEQAQQAPQGTHFSYEYVPPKDPKLSRTYDLVRDMDLFQKLVEVRAADGLFVLPTELHVVTAECGRENAFYSANKAELVLCYELVEDILRQGKEIARKNKYDKNFPDEFLVGTLRFMMAHELGHALIDQLQLPITGREETAADELATVMMLQYIDHQEARGVVESSIKFAGQYLAKSEADNDLPTVVADTHEMGLQRYFNLLCMIYGSDPADLLSVVTELGLPADRATSCPASTDRMMASWYTLLSPHFAPEHQLSEEEWYRKANEGRSEQNKNVENYVR